MWWRRVRERIWPRRAEARAERVLTEAVDGLSDVADYLRYDPVPPVWRELRKYSWDKLRADAFAAAMVAIVTIPQALGFALVVGIPVQAVLITAVIGGAVCAILGNSRHLVFGPTNTVSIILAGALLTVTASPLTPLQKVLVVGFMMGVFQLAAGFFKLGTLTHFISRTVIVAYVTAVGVLIAAGQVGNLLGLGRPDDISLPGIVAHIAVSVVRFDLNPMTAGVGVASLLLMILIRKLRPRWPEGLIVLGIGGALSLGYNLAAFQVPLVRDVGDVVGYMPIFVGFPTNEAGLALIPQLASVAFAAAILGMLETVSISKSLAARSGQKINANQELVAMGAGNLAATAFGAMPGSSSFVRSAVCYEAGAKTQLASIFSSGIVLALLVATAAAVGVIPVASLAAYLILIAIRLVNWEQIRITRRATRSDGVVFWVTLVAALFLQLDTAVYVGIGTSLVLFLRKASAPSLVEYGFNDQGQLAQLEDRGKRRDAAISIVHVEGELFFGAADLFQEQVRYLADDDQIRVVILRMKNARHLDATTVLSLLQLHDYLRKTQRHLLISGINEEVETVLRRSGAYRKIGGENIFPAEANLTMSTKRALLRARALLEEDHGRAGGKVDVRIFYDRKRGGQGESAASQAPRGPVEDYQI
jgi:SulP family sulfate permease